MEASRRDQIIQSTSFLLTGLALYLVLAEHLLVPFLAGLLVYELVMTFTPWAQRYLSSRRGKLIVVALFSAAVIAAIVATAGALVEFFRSDVGDLGRLLSKVTGILDRVRAQIPPSLAAYLPDDTAQLQQRVVEWLRSHLAELQTMGTHSLLVLAETIIALVIGAVVSLREVALESPSGPLARHLTARAKRFSTAFHKVALSQLRIALVNTILTGLFLVALLPLAGIHLPLQKTMIAVTFVASLLPVIGNLISNTVIVLVSLAHSVAAAVIALVFLVVIHKLEYLLNARIVGGRIHAQIWELLIAMMAMEAMFGLAGLVAAPIYYAYLKSELVEARLI
jgi:predicted PurR-regulated permease PerM